MNHPVAIDRGERLARRLRSALDPIDLEIVDDSHAHAGHSGAVFFQPFKRLVFFT